MGTEFNLLSDPSRYHTFSRPVTFKFYAHEFVPYKKGGWGVQMGISVLSAIFERDWTLRCQLAWLNSEDNIATLERKRVNYVAEFFF